MKLSLFIPGIPAPQGSHTAFVSKHNGLASLKESSRRTKPWRKLVAEAVAAHIEAVGWVRLDDCAIEARVTFYFPRPKAAKNRPYPHKVGPGDIDKLQRALFDGLTVGGAWGDDSQLCRLFVDKAYAKPEYDEEPGARVELWRVH
jgi:Holliday junction resolvase RusA-like endonuclease